MLLVLGERGTKPLQAPNAGTDHPAQHYVSSIACSRLPLTFPCCWPQVLLHMGEVRTALQLLQHTSVLLSSTLSAATPRSSLTSPLAARQDLSGQWRARAHAIVQPLLCDSPCSPVGVPPHGAMESPTAHSGTGSGSSAADQIAAAGGWVQLGLACQCLAKLGVGLRDAVVAARNGAGQTDAEISLDGLRYEACATMVAITQLHSHTLGVV
jgi:hypothetical protein